MGGRYVTIPQNSTSGGSRCVTDRDAVHPALRGPVLDCQEQVHHGRPVRGRRDSPAGTAWVALETIDLVRRVPQSPPSGGRSTSRYGLGPAERNWIGFSTDRAMPLSSRRRPWPRACNQGRTDHVEPHVTTCRNDFRTAKIWGCLSRFSKPDSRDSLSRGASTNPAWLSFGQPPSEIRREVGPGAETRSRTSVVLRGEFPSHGVTVGAISAPQPGALKPL